MRPGPFTYKDRADAGRRLASHLLEYARKPGCIVLALPRGGVPVGYEIAQALMLPLDVYLVRKLGVPGHEELAMGAVASDGSYVVDEAIVTEAGVRHEAFAAELVQEFTELKRREAAYRDDLPEPEITGKTVIVVDDGLATGSSMYSAVGALRQRKPRAIVIAVPVAPADTCGRLERMADRVVCPERPEYFGAVGFHYANFEQVSDEAVRRLLTLASRNEETWRVA
ncbi:MAG TPA: phosphoribosyltransferase [Candidatus Nitrosotalea sp.]|nr:phosphoribosyltransferase [Candidatus Nitrosotalea sp.]